MLLIEIMICDDDLSIVEMLEMILAFSGADILTEVNSVKLFDRLKIKKLHLSIIDLCMPVVTGDLVVAKLF